MPLSRRVALPWHLLGRLLAVSALTVGVLPAAHAGSADLSLYSGQKAGSLPVTLVAHDLSAPMQAGAPLVLSGAGGSASVQPQREAGRRNALLLKWDHAWYAALRLTPARALDLQALVPHATLELDLRVAQLAQGGIDFKMACGEACQRKLSYVVPGRALQGKGWQHLSFSLNCFARGGDDFSKVDVPFALEANGAGEVALANVRIVAHGKPNQSCPDYRSIAFEPSPLNQAWAMPRWMQRHEQKLALKQQMLAAGTAPELVFIGDSITEGWENDGKAVWQQYYAAYHALNLGYGGDHTENVLWRLQHGEVDGLQPKVAVLMIGTNNTGDRQDQPEVTAAGVARILQELRQRLPQTRVLLLAIFPREAGADAVLRRINEQINVRLAALADGDKVVFANLNSAMLDADGRLSTSVMPDLLHPQQRGYTIWAEAMQPVLTRMLASQP
ncbi:GDSL-type esterase/lipase family protein [Pseudoduganella danionis]|uniref:1,4-beta-D-glucan glucohydrolase n=1 Tax=Pseudoduganella danionis TaxID=1890295 RepID=A0ABW9SV71_9BURK|nr:GDSL-type esterase/lipase family protein [Pseudoduganella danionis]MTW34569.1 1,4-beta-D-glucan glucohydrolase [Pseudoduganella danionis]